MEVASQQQAPPPCPCQKQLGDALPWLAIAFAFILLLDRVRGWLRKKKERDGAAGGSAGDGGKK